MTLPIGLATVTVTCGPYTDVLGAAYAGVLTFKPSTPVTWAATGAVILDGEVKVTLDAAGSASIVLPATDAAGLTATGFTYTVSFALTSAGGTKSPRYPFLIQLPSAVPAVDLDVLVPAQSAAGVTVALPSVLSVAGLTGAVSGPALLAAIGAVPSSRQVAAGTGLTGGGDLAADRSFAVVYGTTAGTAAQGNDGRLSDARAPLAHASTHASGGTDPITLTQGQVTNLASDLAAKAPLASPGFTGAPTVPTASAGTNTTQAASTAFVKAALATIDGGTP